MRWIEALAQARRKQYVAAAVRAAWRPEARDPGILKAAHPFGKDARARPMGDRPLQTRVFESGRGLNHVGLVNMACTAYEKRTASIIVRTCPCNKQANMIIALYAHSAPCL